VRRSGEAAFGVAEAREGVEQDAAARWVAWLLLAGQCVLAASLAWQWLCVSTHRLYLGERQTTESSAPTRARQRFEIAGGRVEPQILTSEDARLSFPVDLRRPSELRLRAVPGSHATIEIALVQQGARRVLVRRSLSEPADIAEPLPPTLGRLELANQGELVWSDPRVVQQADCSRSSCETGWPSTT